MFIGLHTSPIILYISKHDDFVKKHNIKLKCTYTHTNTTDNIRLKKAINKSYHFVIGEVLRIIYLFYNNLLIWILDINKVVLLV